MYRSLTLLVPENFADDVASVLVLRGADGVEVEDSTVMLMPGKELPPAGQARLIGYFSPEGLDASLLAGVVEEIIGEPVDVHEEEIPARDWNEVWMSHFAPIEISSRLWVCPSWRLGETPENARTLVLDPGMAFGTGTHATTSLCLHALDELLLDEPDVQVLDVGTGSGILAIAAKLLGAGRVVGTDNDPVALQVARENADINHVEIELSDADPQKLAGPFPIVVANIMAHTLKELAPQLVAQVAPGGDLLLSGILLPQGDDVEEAFVAAGMEPKARREDGEWVLIHLVRPAGPESTRE